jgi:predicted secreted protein
MRYRIVGANAATLSGSTLAVPGLRFAAAFLALAVPAASGADEADVARNRVSFEVERSRDVVNDWIQAVVGVTDEDSDPAALADRVNRTMAWALEKARERSDVAVRSGGYRTVPVDRKGRLRHWRATQDLVLEGSDTGAVSALVGELQSRLELHSVVFGVSPESRRRAEDELIAEALGAFKARAEIVRENLGASGHELVTLSIRTPGQPGRPMRAMALAAEADVAPPALEGGSSRLVVHVNGTIELE